MDSLDDVSLHILCFLGCWIDEAVNGQESYETVNCVPLPVASHCPSLVEPKIWLNCLQIAGTQVLYHVSYAGTA